MTKTLNGSGGKYRLEIHLPLTPGKTLAVMGPSGAGKTSLLRMLSGLMKPESGKIEIAGEVWFDSQAGIFRPPQQRSVGFVFQDYGLFPHMTVRENLLFGAEKNTPKEEINRLLEEMNLWGVSSQLPTKLSGGQQQRVALARAFLRKPKLLLLDEPLAALDKPLRLQLQQDLRKFQKELGCTTLLISHDPGEIARLADEVIILENGQITAQGKPETIFGTPNDKGIQAEILAIPAPGKIRVLIGDQILTLDYAGEGEVGAVIYLGV
ncbi:MAG: ATP-binding cassette domain-containing protein [Bacteroidia bacterium]|nr:ATP-binding cassette domain-containing protein [Bacteroidia bacterium]